jgi:TonB family protein
MRRTATLLVLAVTTVACRKAGSAADQTGSTAAASRGFEPPVLTNAESPVRYPPALYEQRIEGTVVLRLYADETGAVSLDSTRIAEGSGHGALDSAALAGVAAMRFAPARLDGVPVASTFLQPVQFRHPEASSPGGDR